VFRLSLIVFCTLGVAVCGVVAKVDARTHYQQSLADYRACLDANPNDPKACESKRLIMEVDERAYNNMSAGIVAGGTTSSNVNVQGR
jgi:hypothetical protein